MSDQKFGYFTNPFNAHLQDIHSYGPQSKLANKGSIFAKTKPTRI